LSPHRPERGRAGGRGEWWADPAVPVTAKPLDQPHRRSDDERRPALAVQILVSVRQQRIPGSVALLPGVHRQQREVLVGRPVGLVGPQHSPQLARAVGPALVDGPERPRCLNSWLLRGGFCLGGVFGPDGATGMRFGWYRSPGQARDPTGAVDAGHGVGSSRRTSPTGRLPRWSRGPSTGSICSGWS